MTQIMFGACAGPPLLGEDSASLAGYRCCVSVPRHHLAIYVLVDVATSLKPTVAAGAERSRASVEIGHGHSGTQFLASKATRRRDTRCFTS